MNELEKKKDDDAIQDNIIKKLKLDKVDKKDYTITEVDKHSTNVNFFYYRLKKKIPNNINVKVFCSRSPNE